MRRKLAAGNWKMNGDQARLSMLSDLAAAHPAPGCDILICPPATLLIPAADRCADGPIAVGGQDCHVKENGAHTGDISAPMLRDAGASYVILGHSERRGDHAETDADVAAKTIAAQAAGLIPIVCLGESEAQRDAGEALEVITAQIEGSVPADSTGDTLVVAYEPIWAIGTGKVPTTDQIAEVHGRLREILVSRFGETGKAISLLYGGSVKAGNAAEIFAVPEVDGALVGGASLMVTDFSPIISALEKA